MKINGCILAFAFLWVNSFCFGQIEKAIEVDHKGCTLSGTLLLPEPLQKSVAVLFISGSGPTDRDGNNPSMKNDGLKMLAESLTDKGYTTLRYDKRGVGKSCPDGVNEEELRFEDYVEDAGAMATYLTSLEGIDSVAIAGHSEGSLVGILAAQRNPIAARFISLAGPGKPAAELIKDQLKAQSPLGFALAAIYLDSLADGHLVKNAPPALNSLLRPSVQPYLVSFFKYDPREEIAKLGKPVLVVNGTTDIQVPESEAIQLDSAATHSNLVIIEGMNHVLKSAPADRTLNIKTYSDPSLPLAPGLAEAILNFLKE